ncbi:transaldolase/EF-hand domain-containing protein [Aquisphaera giovannonii]|uniref:Transaldolase/EF-hand domain-containing protein n=1 Tax=Aquisphaera giovannonii TaxID=406548 RepID=A0A5B9W0F2_9BACT|nr:EF-hand domain-containing protein [Aquisphaera giovannonii]QEH34112.1 transaldolase/EF-hand domain-containing protein [Aquisphaera giovannonii]
MMASAGLLAMALALLAEDEPPATIPPASAFAALGDDAVQDVVILGETRAILLRVRVMDGDRPFRAAWAEGIRAYHARLDGNGDGRLTTQEAAKNGLAALLTPAVPNAGTPARGQPEADVNPKDGVISVEELTEVLRGPFGPFRLQVDPASERRTDALFDQLDRDKDGELTRPEMEAIVGSLRRLDRDADEMIDAGEVNLMTASVDAMAMIRPRPTRDLSTPTVLELSPGESPVRLARLLVKKYDTGSSRGPGRRDSRLSPEEFAIPAEAFAASDRNRDGTLSAEELRTYLADAPRDAMLDVALSADASGRAAAAVRGADGGSPAGMTVRPLVPGAVEVEAGPVRLDVHVDDGARAAESARKGLRARFDAADANQDGYLEKDELNQDNAPISPLAGLFEALDHDGDGKVYPRELDEFVAREAVAARGHLTMTASDEGRALFGMLDTDRDRRLGAREVLETFARVSACDRNQDGRVNPDEIPQHVRLVLDRGDLSVLLATPANANVVVVSAGMVVAPSRPRPAAGPIWFRKMDRNHDGDVSPREFLGTRDQFDRLDRDHDGLLSPAEAQEASPGRPDPVKAPGG